MKRLLGLVLAMIMLVSCATTEQAVGETGTMNIEDRYPSDRYVVAMGFGATRESAELNAKTELVSIFGSAVKTSVRESTRSSIGMQNGQSIVDDIVSFASDSSVTANIRSIWGMQLAPSVQSRDGWESIAYVEKKPTIDWYRANLPALLDSIEETIAILSREKGSWKGIGTANKLYGMLIDYNNDVGIYNYLSGDDYRYYNSAKAMKLIEDVRDSVSVYVEVAGDDNGYLKSNLEKAFTDLGWRVARDGSSCSVILNADINWNISEGSGNSFIFAYYDSSMSLKDKATGHTIEVFALQGKEAHKSEANAKKRAMMVIAEGYMEKLMDALTAEEVR